MQSPNDGRLMLLLESTPETYVYRRHKVVVQGMYWECQTTKEKYATPEQLNYFLKQVRDKWHKQFERLRYRTVRLPNS